MAITNLGADPFAAAGNALSYFVGQCTRLVAEMFSWVPAGLGNANQWLSRAPGFGLQTIGPTLNPPVGSVAAWNDLSGFGHVAAVVGSIPGGGFQVKEENFLGTGTVDLRDVTSLAGLSGFILPPGGLSLPSVPNPFAGAPNPLDVAGAIAGLPASIGHGLANATSASVNDVATFARNQVVPLIVALVVALVIFAPDSHGSS